jgi:hypothetical protein
MGIKLAWIALGLLLLVSFGFDFGNVRAGGSIDLRNRITGARLLGDGLDPYFYKWHEPEPPQYADPYNNPLLPVSKTTATPALLLAHLPFARLPYQLAQFLWFFLQWLLLLGTAWLWLRRCPNEKARLLLAAFITGFTYTAAWRLHAERGQAYVLLLFLFAAWLAATLAGEGNRARWTSALTGFVAGLLATFRPPFLLLAPFLVLRSRTQGPGAVAGLLLGFLLPLCWRGDVWNQYFAAMEVHSSLYRHGIDPAPPPERFPPAIEGMRTDLLANYAPIPYADFSLHGALLRLEWEPVPAWLPLLLVTAGYLAWLGWSRREPLPRLLLGLAVWFYLIDLCLPAYRNIYNDVQILNLVALGLIAAGRGPVPWGVRICFLALPVGWVIAGFAPRDDLLTDLPSLVLLAGAVLLFFGSTSRPLAAR